MKYKEGDKVVLHLGSAILRGVIEEADGSAIPYKVKIAQPDPFYKGSYWAREDQVRLENGSNTISNQDSYTFNIPEGYCADWQIGTEWEEEDTIVCECGAKHTTFPDIHSTWCPMHEEQL